MKKATMGISGMTCASCALTIESGLKKQKGIKEANVNFAVEKLTVTFDEKQTDEQKIKKAVEGLGYGAY